MPYDKILNGENLLKKSKVFIGIACNAEKFAIVFFVVFSPSFFPTCQFFGNILLKAFLRQFLLFVTREECDQDRTYYLGYTTTHVL